MIKYLTQLVNQRVYEPDGAAAGKITDALARLGGRLPQVNALVVTSGAREFVIPYAELALEESGARLKTPLERIPPYRPESEELRLVRDVLDKKIVDVHDYSVVRVNDVRLAECRDHFCVVGVDAGLRAFLRRLGVSGPVETAAKWIRKPLRSNLIAWDDVETLETDRGGRIKLKVSHEKIARLHPADIADIVEQLDPQQRAQVIESLDIETAADTIEEMQDEVSAQVMETLDEEKAADILEEMEPDEAADVLADLSDARSEDLLEQMEPEERADVEQLLQYEEETAGGLMTTEFVAIPANLTCEQTIGRLRELSPKAEMVYYVYVTDDDDRLAGVLSLRDLIVADPETHISDIMVQNVIRVHDADHADEVAQVFGRYNLLAVPVVDEEERLRGIITVDDTLERLLPPEKRRRLPQVAVEKADDGADEDE